MTVLTVLAVLESTSPSFCWSYKIQDKEATVTVLASIVQNRSVSFRYRSVSFKYRLESFSIVQNRSVSFSRSGQKNCFLERF